MGDTLRQFADHRSAEATMSAWSTGPVGNNHRAILRDGRVVAVAESVEEAAHIVRWMNEMDRATKQKWREMEDLKANLRKLAEDPPDPDQDMETIPL